MNAAAANNSIQKNAHAHQWVTFFAAARSSWEDLIENGARGIYLRGTARLAQRQGRFLHIATAERCRFVL